MNNFCQFCGTELEPETDCNCDAAVAHREATAHPATEPVLEMPPEIVTPEILPVTPTAPPVVPTDPPKEKAPSPIAKGMGKVGSTFLSFLRHPIQTATESENIPAVASLILILLNALFFVFFNVVFLRKQLSEFPSFSSGFLAPIASSLAGALVLFLFVYLFSKIFGKGASLKSTFGAVALSYIPWIIGFLILAVATLTLGAYPLYLIIGTILVLSFVNTFSLLILERSLTTKIKRPALRILTLAIAVSLQNTAIVIVFGRLIMSSSFALATGVLSSL